MLVTNSSNDEEEEINQCVRYIPEALETSFAEIPRSYKNHAVTTSLKPEDKRRRKDFAVSVLDRLDSDPWFSKRVRFVDGSTFHVSRILNRHNLRI